MAVLPSLYCLPLKTSAFVLVCVGEQTNKKHSQLGYYIEASIEDNFVFKNCISIINTQCNFSRFRRNYVKTLLKIGIGNI